jgi:hypothetical protein
MRNLVILLIVPLISFSQIPEIKWQQCFGTKEWDKSYGITEKENGYLAGINIESNGPGITNYHGESDEWLINIDSTGDVIWEKCFGGIQSESLVKLVSSKGNTYYVFGGTESSDYDVTCEPLNDKYEFWVLKINSEGEILWDKCYGSPEHDTPRDAILTPDGGLLFMGRILSQGGNVHNYYGSMDIWFCKIDSLGTMEWEKTVGNENLDNAISLKLISNTSFAFIGGYDEPGGMIDCEIAVTGEYMDLWLVEMSLNDGDILDMNCYGGSGNDLGCYFDKLNDGFILTASTDSYDGDVSGLHGEDDIWVVRINNDGEIVWQRCLGGSYNEVPSYVTKVEDGGFIIIGYTDSHNGDVSNNHSYTGGAYYDIWVVKLSANGEIEWDQCYGGLETERFFGSHSILKKSDYNYVFNAQARMNSGDVQCEFSGDIDAWVFEIDTVDTTGAIQNNYENVIKVYPNPAEEFVVFDYSSPYPPQGGKYPVIVVTTIFGQEVVKLPVKPEKTVWDCREAEDGIYFYSVEIEGKWYAGKVVIRKRN